MNGARRTRWRAALGLAVAAACCAGCSEDPKLGYSLRDQYRGGIRTVAVPIWARGRDVYRRDIEIRLTQAIVDRVLLDTPYKVTDKAHADTLLEGSLDRIEQQTMSRNPDTGRPREMEVTFVVSFTWTDLRGGQVLKKHSNFRVAGTYVPEEPLGEEFFQGSEEIINRVAERVVEQMEADW